ncbi:ABC transporter substrate-binding protein [Mycobacterium sp. NAZ190054]|uniref:ABC transporter substrate-binding protein n=1 Tax=Mycobacterium sp. NAZ190054 TaxID=1747766 RepID=UPI0018D22557|nr:ABC transporter substrate-binding protein [Mycobacterium sp. NAZ190054]
MSRALIRKAALVAAVVLTVAGCGGNDDTESSSDGPLRAVSGSSQSFNSLVPYAAWKILAEESGIEVEQRYLEDGPTAIQAISQGEAVIGTDIGVNVGVPAVDAGAEIVDVVSTQRLTWALAARPEITSLEQLDGKRIAVHGEASFTNAISDFFARENGYEYEKLIIPGSEVRAEALAQGQIDASVIDLSDIVTLSAQYPGQFEVLATVGEEVPDLIEQDIWLDRKWAEANPETATAVVKSLVEAERRLSDDPEWALSVASEFLPDTDEQVLRELVTEYAERGLWPADGLLNRERARQTLEFFNDLGEIEVTDLSDAGLDKYFAFQYLESALEQLGDK